jgi:hypothetical protein
VPVIIGPAGQVHEQLMRGLDCLRAAPAKSVGGCRQLQYLNIARTALLPGQSGVTSTSLIAEQLGIAVESIRPNIDASNSGLTSADDLSRVDTSLAALLGGLPW